MHFLLMRDQGPTPLNDCPTLPCPRLACTSFTPETVDALHAALAGLIIAMTSAAFSDQLALSIATKRIDDWATGLLGYHYWRSRNERFHCSFVPRHRRIVTLSILNHIYHIITFVLSAAQEALPSYSHISSILPALHSAYLIARLPTSSNFQATHPHCETNAAPVPIFIPSTKEPPKSFGNCFGDSIHFTPIISPYTRSIYNTTLCQSELLSFVLICSDVLSCSTTIC